MFRRSLTQRFWSIKDNGKQSTSKALQPEGRNDRSARRHRREDSHKRTIGNEAAYAINWAELIKLITEVFKLILLCTIMVPNEEDIMGRFIRGLPDIIQGNVIAVNPVRFQDAVRIANQLMDKKLQGYAAR
ncbi:hypothetical protein Tco_0215410 [Tanacetum coccineum]